MKLDPVFKITHPRLLAALYFGLLSIAGTIIIDAILTSIGIEHIIPILESVLLGIMVSAGAGAIFGESIVHCPKPYKSRTFWLGFSMIIASLPIFDLGLVLIMEESNNHLFAIVKFHHLVYLYLVVLAYSYILFGMFLAVATGIAAMYLRSQLVYDILHTHERRKDKKRTKIVVHKNKKTHQVQSTHH